MPPAFARTFRGSVRARSLIWGLVAAVGAALLAQLLSFLMPLPPVFYALLIGMLFAALIRGEKFKAGADFATREVLRFGVALLGATITLSEIAGLGWALGSLAVAALLTTLVAGTWLCRRLGDSREASIVSAAAVAICGASAALASAAALPQGSVKQDELARTVAGITLAGTLGMIIFPFLGTLLDLSPAALGAFLGGSLHEVAQAAASGFAVSEEVGKAATLVKMLRVACMGAIIAAIPLLIYRGRIEMAERPPLFPTFLIIFAMLAVFSSVGLIPAFLRDAATDVSRWCLLIAIAALGMRTSITTLFSAGARPLIAIALNSMLIAALMLGGVLLIGS